MIDCHGVCAYQGAVEPAQNQILNKKYALKSTLRITISVYGTMQ